MGEFESNVKTKNMHSNDDQDLQSTPLYDEVIPSRRYAKPVATDTRRQGQMELKENVAYGNFEQH